MTILDEKQRKEMVEIVTGLPPAVFGDVVAKEQSRVLVDLIADAKECAKIDKIKLGHHDKVVETTIEIFQQTLASLTSSDDQFHVVIGAIKEQSAPLRMKIMMKQLIASHCMDASYSSREELVHQLLSGNEIGDVSNNNITSSPTITTTTTTTATSSSPSPTTSSPPITPHQQHAYTTL